jgi:hypothetical protein
MYSQSSSIKSSFVGLVGGDISNDYEMNPIFNDSFDVLMFLGGSSTTAQSVGSNVWSSSYFKSLFLILLSFKLSY